MSKQGSLLVIDDNRNIIKAVKMLAEDTFETITAISNPNNIPARLREDKPDVALLDMNFSAGINSGNEGLYWLREIKRLRRQTEVVLFTAYADIDLAVKGIKEGAADFVVKPWDNRKLLETLTAARDKNSPGTGGKRLSGSRSGMFWGDDEVMRELRSTVEKVASTDANILITGENGTGKEVLANEIHRLSARSGGVMMPIDMGAVSETLFESELFGHVKGAFTDAHADRAGKFELAEGGTLFLDEIGNLSYSLQAKLLAALQRRRIVRVGGSQEIPINVRLICATNRDLNKMVAEGTFREDLLYRINTIRLHLPPLRERRADIVPLARMFLDKYSAVYNKQSLSFTDEAERKLAELPWHGNIREMQHSIEKAVIMADGALIGAGDIECDQRSAHEPAAQAQTLDDMERAMIEQAISDCKGNLSVVASRLGISRQTLYNKIKRYGL